MKAKFETTGNVLRSYRELRELSQAKLAKEIGIHVQFVSNYERGLCMPPSHCMPKLIKALRVIRSDLFMAITMDASRANKEKVDKMFKGLK